MAKEEREVAGDPGRHRCGWVSVELNCVDGLCRGSGPEGLAASAGDEEKGARAPWAVREAGTSVTLRDVCREGRGTGGSEARGATWPHKPPCGPGPCRPQPRTAAAGRRVAGPRKC